jgi:AcrR family transcriptional regulator
VERGDGVPRKVKKPDERKGELVTVARQLFFTRGYAKTTITDIIENAEVSKGLFYYYFGSKEEILDAIVNELIVQDVTTLTAIAEDETLSVPERIVAMLGKHRAFLSDPLGHVSAQLRTIQNPEVVIRTIKLSVLRLTPLFAALVKEGATAGIFAIDDPEVCVEVLLSSYTFDAVFGDETHAIGKANAFRRVFESTLGAKPGTLLID